MAAFADAVAQGVGAVVGFYAVGWVPEAGYLHTELEVVIDGEVMTEEMLDEVRVATSAPSSATIDRCSSPSTSKTSKIPEMCLSPTEYGIIYAMFRNSGHIQVTQQGIKHGAEDPHHSRR